MPALAAAAPLAGAMATTTNTTATSTPLSTPPAGSPHAVRQTGSGATATFYYYDGRGNQTVRDAPGTANDRRIRYSLDDKAHEIVMGSGQRVRFWYGPDGQRYKRQEGGKTTLYLGGVEVVIQNGVSTFKRYLGGIAIQTVANGGVIAMKYLFHDHLGSLVRIANADGSLAERLDYAAFGERRGGASPFETGSGSSTTDRGFTGHEMIDGTGVIHMNGRIYDAQLGRFLQADPVIQARDNAQSWNAYTYVFNNPLAYTDPSGMISLRQALGIVVAVVGTVFAPQFASVWTKIGYAALIGAASGYVSTGTMQGALWGAFSAAAFAGVGAYFDSAGAGWAQAAEGSSGVFGGGLNAAGYGAKVLAHGITGGVMSKLQGGKFGHGFASAGVTQALSPGIDRIDAGNTGVSALRIAAAAVVGGTASTLSGGKFANGALTGAFSRAFNDELHSPSRQEMLGRRVGSANIKDYDRNDPTFHEYKFTSQLCSTGPGCDVDSLMWVGADSAPKFGSVSNGLNVLHMKNPILHSSYIARDGSFYMVNVTHWNHDFHAGAVVNRLFQSDSGVYLSTHGFGYSSSTAARVANYVVGYGYFSAWHSQSVSAAKIQTGQIKPLK